MNQSSLIQIISNLFISLSDGTIKVSLILVDFASRKTPIGTLLPALHEQHLIHGIIKYDSATNWYTRLICEELIEGLHILAFMEVGKKRAMLKHL